MPASPLAERDRKSTRLNSSHRCISYAVFCLEKHISQPGALHHALHDLRDATTFARLAALLSHPASRHHALHDLRDAIKFARLVFFYRLMHTPQHIPPPLEAPVTD